MQRRLGEGIALVNSTDSVSSLCASAALRELPLLFLAPLHRRASPILFTSIGACIWAVLLMLLPLFAGCARQLPPDDTLVIGQVAEPRSLDPHVTTALNDFRILVMSMRGWSAIDRAPRS